MYNERLKLFFIKANANNMSHAKEHLGVFHITEPYEKEWDADVCTRPVEDLQPIVNKLAGLRNQSKYSRLLILKNYVKWCMANNVPGACDAMLHIKEVGLDAIKRQLVTNPLHLQTYLDIIFSPESSQGVDNTYRCYCWLAYAGMLEADILKVTKEDVDFENMVVTYNGFEYPIYREALPCIKNCVNLSTFLYQHPNYNSVYKKRVDGNEIMRGFRSSPSAHTLRILISRSTKKALSEGKTSTSLSYRRIWLSGVFFEMYEREKAGLPVDFLTPAARFAAIKGYKPDGAPSADVRIRHSARCFDVDYKRWKMAFML